MIGDNRSPLPHGFGSHGTLVRTQPDADKALGQFSIRLFAYQFVGEVTAPEINAGHLKKFSCHLAEKLDQGLSPGPFARFGGNTEQQLLEALIGSRGKTVFRGNDRTATRNAESCAEISGIVFLIHKCLNLLGNYLSSQFESREMGDGVPSCEIPRLG